MLTGRMLEKFTKRIQDLNKVKKQHAESHYNLIEDEEYNLDENKQSQKNQSQSQKNISSNSGENQKQSLESINQSNQVNKSQKQASNVIPFQEQKIFLLDRIKSKIAGMRPQKQRQKDEINKSSENKSQNKGKSPKIRVTRQGTSKQNILDKDKKQQVFQIQSCSENSQQEAKQQKQQNNNRRAVVSQILKQIKNMSNQQKNGYIRAKTKENKLLSTHELKIWIDAYELIFNVENQIKKFDQKPNQKVISKKFAQQFIRYVKRNIHEKRYKFRRICAYALKQLDLTSQKVDTWLNRFVIQNIQHLKGIDISQYKSPNVQVNKNKIIIQKNKQKKQESKNNLKFKKQIVDVQIEQPQKNNIQQKKQIKPIKNRRKIQKMKLQQTPQSIQKSFSQSQKQSQSPKIKKKSKIIEDKKKQKQMLQKVKNKINFKKQIQQQKQIEIQQQQKKEVKKQNIKILPDKNLKKMQNKISNNNSSQKNYSQTKSISNSLDKRTNMRESFYSSMYPESFKKKIAAKLDQAFGQIFQSLLKQKCQEFCVEQQALKQIYEQHGVYSFNRSKQPIQIEQIKQNNHNLIPEVNPNKINSQPKINQIIANYENKNEFFYTTAQQQEKINGKKEIPKSNQRIQVQAPMINQKKITSLNSINNIQEPRPKSINPYQILGHKLNYFLRNNQGCSQNLIKQQAIKIITTTPEIVGKIKQESLARWINNFLERHKEKMNWNKPSQPQNNNMYNISNPMNYNSSIKINNESSQSKLPIKQFYASQNMIGNHQQQNNHQVYLKPSPQQTKASISSQNGHEKARNFQISMPKANGMRVDPKNFVNQPIPKRM